MEAEKRQVLIVLPGERPMSLNKVYAGVHWKVRKDEAERVHWLVRAKIDPDEPMFERPVNITVTAYFRSHPFDASNILIKLYEDGLKKRLIADDGPRYVRSVTAISRVDRKRPRVEILIEEES